MRDHAFEDCAALYESAHALLVAALAPEHLDVGESLYALGRLELSRRRFDDAIEQTHRALAIFRTTLGGRHPKVARVLNLIALTEKNRRRLPEAIAGFEDALDMAREQLGDGHPDTRMILANLGNAHLAAGDPQAALDAYNRWQETASPKSPLSGITLAQKATALLKLGRSDEAAAAIDQALALIDTEPPRQRDQLLRMAERLRARL